VMKGKLCQGGLYDQKFDILNSVSFNFSSSDLAVGLYGL
jgi:hypothetical protein